MRVKAIPQPPDDPGVVWEARRAIPLVPNDEFDCCVRLMDRLGIDEREAARTWLTFLRGLGLVEEGPQGFSRTRGDPDLAAAFRAGVFGAEEVLDILAAADEPLDTAAVFEAFEPHVPEWERRRHPDAWRGLWRDRVDALLGWCALLGLAERADGGYRA